MTIIERSALDPLSFNQIGFIVTEFPDLDFTFSVFAIKFESDPIIESLEP